MPGPIPGVGQEATKLSLKSCQFPQMFRPWYVLQVLSVTIHPWSAPRVRFLLLQELGDVKCIFARVGGDGSDSNTN